MRRGKEIILMYSRFKIICCKIKIDNYAKVNKSKIISDVIKNFTK